jgi:hypothetical protein
MRRHTTGFYRRKVRRLCRWNRVEYGWAHEYTGDRPHGAYGKG